MRLRRGSRPDPEARLQAEHEPAAIRRRLGHAPRMSYLRDFIYGAIDGTVTTFAVVAGVEGGELSASVVLILGGANLIADGFSMAVSNYLGLRAERQRVDADRREEERHVRLVPAGEREEIRQIFATKGFEGEDLERVVEVITQDRDRWVETMLTEELGHGGAVASPLRAAATTMAAFLAIGLFPLGAFIVDVAVSGGIANPFAWSAVMTCVAFFAIGSLKSRFVDQSWWAAGLETLAVGAAAAALAYGAGAFLQAVV